MQWLILFIRVLLSVEQLPSSDEDDEDRSSRRSRRDSGGDDRFGDEYWRRAEHKGKSHQKSWEEMRHRPAISVETRDKVQQSFFLLPGDLRLNGEFWGLKSSR